MKARLTAWSEPWGVMVADGQLEAYERFDKYGLNGDLDINSTPEDIWEFGGLYTWPDWGTAPIDTISSSSASDTAIIIKLFGLDIGGYKTSQEITLDGQNKVTLDTPLYRCHRGYNTTGTNLVGDLYVYEDTAIVTGVPADATKVRTFISADRQQTEQAIYTVPMNHTLFLDGFITGLENRVTASIVVTIHVRALGGVWRDSGTGALNSTGTGIFDIQWNHPRRFEQLTDVRFTVEATSANSAGAFALLDGVLRDDSVEYGR